MAHDVEYATLGMVGQFDIETKQRMPSDALSQFLARRAELKRNLATYETGNRFGSPERSHIHIRALRHQITEYERAIAMLMPQPQSAYTH